LIEITPDRFVSKPSTASRFIGVPNEKPFRKRKVRYQDIRYSNIPLSMTPKMIGWRRWRDRLLGHSDARICLDCKYAFLSKGGTNRCGSCWQELRRQWRASIPSHIDGFCATPSEFGRYVGRTSLVRSRQPWYPIPDLRSAKVQKAIAATLEVARREQEEDRWILGPSPRLVGNLHYPNVPRAVLTHPQDPVTGRFIAYSA
jgi:hypothetical protein